MGKILIIKNADFSSVSLGSVTIEDGKLELVVLSNPTNGGVVSGSGRYSRNSIVEISAIANDNYEFVKWNDGDINSTRTITLNEDKMYTALFNMLSQIQVHANYKTLNGYYLFEGNNGFSISPKSICGLVDLRDYVNKTISLNALNGQTYYAFLKSDEGFDSHSNLVLCDEYTGGVKLNYKDVYEQEITTDSKFLYVMITYDGSSSPSDCHEPIMYIS